MAVEIQVQDTSKTEYKARLIADYIIEQSQALSKRQSTEGPPKRPLMVSMQGPQGAGKSTLAAALVELLASDSYELKTAVASLDDFYLPYSGLKSLAQSHPNNALLAGRGPPGTHDVPLLSSTLHEVAKINASSSSSRVNLPFFDKSLHDGFGDRSPTPIPLEGPIDVFILEGWSLGYSAIDESSLQDRWKAGRTASTHSFETLKEINSNLTEFANTIHDHFDAHVAIQPSTFDHVYRWRLQQEHHMKSLNGGKGMSDDAVRKFVDRYMPVYECYAQDQHAPPCLTLYFGPDREVEKVDLR